jgi:hypothetical protein
MISLKGFLLSRYMKLRLKHPLEFNFGEEIHLEKYISISISSPNGS